MTVMRRLVARASVVGPPLAPPRRMGRRRARGFAIAALVSGIAVGAGHLLAEATVELMATGGLPAHLVGIFEEPIAFQALADGRQLVFDRRAHAVYVVDALRRAATKIVQVGSEDGRVLGPVAMDAAPDNTFVVADAPSRRERIQHFDADGKRLGGFTLPGRSEPRVSVGSLVLNGVGSLQFTGTSVLINQPETGALITEYSLNGYPLRSIGRLRATGQEEDRQVHLALNTGLPLTTADGGFFFVFQTGEPVFRKYDKAGAVVFERLVQGRDLDDYLKAIPRAWPKRQVGSQELPLVSPTIRTAAVDRAGGLWLSFAVPVTYRYDADGDRVGAYRFRGAGPLQPTSLFFTGDHQVIVTPGLFEFTFQ